MYRICWRRVQGAQKIALLNNTNGVFVSWGAEVFEMWILVRHASKCWLQHLRLCRSQLKLSMFSGDMGLLKHMGGEYLWCGDTRSINSTSQEMRGVV